MTNKEIGIALQTLRPRAEWSLTGDTLEGLEWLDRVQERPTNKEIEAAIASYVPPLTVEQKLELLQEQINELKGINVSR